MGGPVSRPVVTLQSVAGVLTIDLARGDLFQVTLTENITSIVMANPPPSGMGSTFMLWITQHASAVKTVAFPASFDWDSKSVETVSSSVGAVDLLAGTTRNGGTTFDVTLSKDRG